MTRDFTEESVAPRLIDEFLDAARRAPAAGNSAAAEFLVLEGSVEVGSYWDVTLAPARRRLFPWPGLLSAPVLVVVFVEPAAYVERYAEADKAASGLGVSEAAWSTPYWWVDGGMAAMTVLLAAEEAGLGALFFGLFEHEAAVKERFGVPNSRRAVGTIAIGHRADAQVPSSSARRGRPPLAEVVHRSSWRQPR